MKGLIIRSSKNNFSVRIINKNGLPRELECKLKGKILKDVVGFYNPLACGDIVEVDEEKALILSLESRVNGFFRYNQKGQLPQLLASNVDLVLCLCSIDSPPFRPRFLDRLLLQADVSNIPSAIICNKYDLAGEKMLADPDIEERLSDYMRIGIPVFRISVKSRMGMKELMSFIEGKFSVLTGQSGVGKSSFINALVPDLEIKTAMVNEKYNRGNHTTTQAIMYDIPGITGTRIIDTPGIRRFVPMGISPDEVIFHMKEFAALAGQCSYGLSCSHITERGCKIMEAVDAGAIHEDRYESFLRIREELSGREYSKRLD